MSCTRHSSAKLRVEIGFYIGITFWASQESSYRAHVLLAYARKIDDSSYGQLFTGTCKVLIDLISPLKDSFKGTGPCVIPSCSLKVSIVELCCAKKVFEWNSLEALFRTQVLD